jgi:phosphatidylethanolamine/phosphatidyl-N-methylethanolamine N-methyltransferase
MSGLFLKRFLRNPFKVASVIPSSKVLVKKVAAKLDFSVPRVIVEFGPGEGVHSREIVSRMHPDSRLLLFELDPELARHLAYQFADDSRVSVLNADAQTVQVELERHDLPHCDYVLSGIPFSILEKNKKRKLLHQIYSVLAPAAESAFIIYQVTNELRQHAATFFPRAESEYCLQNVPPMFITVFYKLAANGFSTGQAQFQRRGR